MSCGSCCHRVYKSTSKKLKDDDYKLIDGTNLSEYQKTYLKINFTKDKLGDYSEFKFNYSWDVRLGMFTLVGGILVSAAVGLLQFEMIKISQFWSDFVPAGTFLLSIIVNIATGIHQKFLFKEKAQIYRTNYHSLKRKGKRFFTLEGKWKDQYEPFCNELIAADKNREKLLASLDEDDDKEDDMISNGDEKKHTTIKLVEKTKI